MQRPPERALEAGSRHARVHARRCLARRRRGCAHWRHRRQMGKKKRRRQAIQKNPNQLGSFVFYRFTVGKTGVMALLDFGVNPRIP